MTRSRLILYFFFLLLFGLLGTSWYMYQNFPRLVNQYLGQLAQQYGVQDVKFEGLKISSNALTADKLWLQGTYEGYAYEATLRLIQVPYDWRSLGIGRVQSVVLASLDLAVVQHTSTSDSGETVLDLESLNPQRIIAQLPVDALHIKQFSFDYRALDLPPLSFGGILQVTENVELQLTTLLAGSGASLVLRTSESPPILDLDITQYDGDGDGDSHFTSFSAQLLQATDTNWQWQFQGEWDDAAFRAWLHRFAEQMAPAFDTTTLQVLNLAGSTRFTGTVLHPNKLNLPLSPALSTLAQFDATLHLAQTIHRLDYADSLENLRGAIDSTLTLENGRVHWASKPFQFEGNLSTALLTLPPDTQQWLRLKDWVPVKWSSSKSLSVTSDDGGIWTGRLPASDIELGDGDTRLNLEALELTAILRSGNDVELDTSLRTLINTRLRNQLLPQLSLVFSQQGTLGRSTYRLELEDSSESISILGQGNVDVTTGQGEHRLSVETPDLPAFTLLVIPPLNHFGVLQTAVAIGSGDIQLDTELRTTDFEPMHWTQVSRLELTDLSGSVGENRFEQLGLSAQWSGIEHWKTLRPIKFALKKLESGIEVRDISAQMTLPKPTPIAQPEVKIETLSAAIFGGSLVLPDAVTWDFGVPDNTFTLRARQWQLADLVALQQDENIQASGELEGELPVTIADGRVIIEKGYLKAIPPGGSIRYSANNAGLSLGESSKELALALELLSNFQYQTLGAEVELDIAGNLLLGLSLAGSNPERFDGRQVNFNINLEQNIDPLLQSLRVSDTLVEKIEQRLK